MPDRAPFLIVAGGIGVAGLLAALGAFGYDAITPSHVAAAKPATSSPAAKPSQTPVPSPTVKPGPIRMHDLFPKRMIELDGKPFRQSRVVVNTTCADAARGRLAQALTQRQCRRVLRGTYVDSQRSLAVSGGIAIMPTSNDARDALRIEAPGRYEWFHALTGPRAKQIDREGGFATGAARGRYIVYAYAIYADGRQAEAGDPVLQAAGDRFRDYLSRPINRRV